MKIAIDGPAGAGKSTIAKLLAAELGFVYIDTGAMYRTLAWKALNSQIDLYNPQALLDIALNTHISFEPGSQVQQKVICDSVDVTDAIRSPQVSAVVSQIASYTPVRQQMVKIQQEMASSQSVVMDGRDIGECVLPDADYKFFVTASLEERTRRRIIELQNSGYQVNEADVRYDIMKRDHSDANREVGALKTLPDSIVMDTSHMTVEEALQEILRIIREG